MPLTGTGSSASTARSSLPSPAPTPIAGSTREAQRDRRDRPPRHRRARRRSHHRSGHRARLPPGYRRGYGSHRDRGRTEGALPRRAVAHRGQDPGRRSPHGGIQLMLLAQVKPKTFAATYASLCRARRGPRERVAGERGDPRAAAEGERLVGVRGRISQAKGPCAGGRPGESGHGIGADGVTLSGLGQDVKP